MPELNSKNPHIRESISSYLVVLSEFIEFPSTFASILNKMKQDPNPNVRSKVASLISSQKQKSPMRKKVKIEESKRMKVEESNKENIIKLKQSSKSKKEKDVSYNR